MVTGDLTTFTWRYVAKIRDNAAQARTISLTIGTDGRVRGMSGGK
jgi:hypothetical protein